MTAAITIHFRQPDITAACIDSLLVDGWAPVLVWDNSADGGATRRVLQTRFAEDARVQWGHNSSNLGFGKGMNAALAELGRCGYVGPVLLINNDARVTPGMRTALRVPLQVATGPIMVAPRILQDGQEYGWLYYQPWFALVTHRPLPGSFPYLSGCCLLVQRADNAQPLFDEDFFMYGEDVELSWRWRRQGGKLVLLDHTWLQHAGSASSGQASATYESNVVRGHWLLVGKLGNTVLSQITMYFMRVPTLLARALVRAVRFSSSLPIRALGAIVR